MVDRSFAPVGSFALVLRGLSVLDPFGADVFPHSGAWLALLAFVLAALLYGGRAASGGIKSASEAIRPKTR